MNGVLDVVYSIKGLLAQLLIPVTIVLYLICNLIIRGCGSRLAFWGRSFGDSAKLLGRKQAECFARFSWGVLICSIYIISSAISHCHL